MKKVKLVHLPPITYKGKVYDPVIIPGSQFSDNKRTTENIRKVAKKARLLTPPRDFADNAYLDIWEHAVEHPSPPPSGRLSKDPWGDFHKDLDAWENSPWRMPSLRDAGARGFFRKAYPEKKVAKLGFDWLVIMHKPIVPPRHAVLWPTYDYRVETLTVLGRDASWYYDVERFEDREEPAHTWWPKDGFIFLAPKKGKK